MPAGNAHYIPSGIWYQTPETYSYKLLALRSLRNYTIVAACFGLAEGYRWIASNITYNSFRGRTMTLGTHSIATHEPASVEYVDQLKQEMIEKRQRLRQEMGDEP